MSDVQGRMVSNLSGDCLWVMCKCGDHVVIQDKPAKCGKCGFLWPGLARNRRSAARSMALHGNALVEVVSCAACYGTGYSHDAKDPSDSPCMRCNGFGQVIGFQPATEDTDEVHDTDSA